MSRAFTREDPPDEPRRQLDLPDPEDPRYDAAAAVALLDAARAGEMHVAEEATGYRWGEPSLHPHVRRLLAQAESVPEAEQDRRYIQLAKRFLAG